MSPESRNRESRTHRSHTLAFAALIVVAVFTGCDGQAGCSQRQGAGGGTTAGAQRQAEEYERQMAASQRHLDETGRQLAESAANLRTIAVQNEQFNELLHRWASQADRVDALLLRWEKLTDTMEGRLEERP